MQMLDHANIILLRCYVLMELYFTMQSTLYLVFEVCNKIAAFIKLSGCLFTNISDCIARIYAISSKAILLLKNKFVCNR